MTKRSTGLFEELEPPRGGLAGLRTRLELDRSRRRRRRVEAALATAAVAGLVLLALFVGPLPTAQTDLPHPTLRVRLGLDPLPDETLIIAPAQRNEIAAQRVPLTTDRVVFYLVASRVPVETAAQLAASEEPVE